MYLSCKSLLFFYVWWSTFSPQVTLGSCCGIQSELTWPLPSWTRSAPSTSSTRGLFLFILLNVEWNSDSKSLRKGKKKNRSWNRQLETTVREQITWPKSYLLIRVRKRRFLLCALYLSQPLNKTPKEFFHRVRWLAGGCRVRDYIADEVFPGLNSSPEGLS